MFRQSLTRLYRTRPITCPPPYRSNLSRYFSQPQTRPFSSSSITRGVHVRFSSPNPTLDPNGNHDKTIKIAAVLFGFGTIYYVANLEQVPETGRWRFMNTGHKGEEQMAEIARRQSQEAYRDIALPPHHPLSQHVRRVVSRILAASNLGVIRGVDVLYSSVGGAGGDGWDPDAEVGARGPGWVPGQEREWDVMVVNDPKVVNAEVVPGLIIVYTGILPVCRDEQGLAAVLSHEIGHVVARHLAERLSSQTILIGFMLLFQVTLGLDAGISNLIQKLLFELPNSRAQELEADKIGLTLMARACFDPNAAPEMFVRLGKVQEMMGGKSMLDFLQTHPSSSRRVQELEQILPDAYAVIAANPDCAVLQDQLQRFRGATPGFVSGVGEPEMS